VQRGLDAYWKVYRTSWKQDEPFPDFINGLVRWCACHGKLRLGILSLRGEPVAAQIWLVHQGRAEIFKVAYDEAHKAVSPGSVLTAALLEQVIDRDQVHEVDFLVGDDAYKRTWMSHRRERWGLVAFDPLQPKGAWGLARMSLGRWVRRITRQSLVSPAQLQAEA
jgi:CelD/BcsL family acetyltransferase involved in cellulose biosynthesis